MRSVPARFVVGIALAVALTGCAPGGGGAGGVVSVSIVGGDRSVVIGDALTLAATVVATGTASAAVGWSSSQEAVATVSAGGQVTSLSAGTASITATSVTDPGKSDTITVDPLAVPWTRQFGTSGSDTVSGVATDANGNVYAAGRTLGDLEGANAGGSDAFLRSYDGAGHHRFTLQFGTGSEGDARGVATDRLGNVFAAGTTSSALEGTGAGGEDGFIRKHGR